MSLTWVFFNWSDALAQPQTKTGSSFLEALLTFLILIVLCGGIYLALKIHSLLRGGELSPVWIFSGSALAVLFVSILIVFLNNLGILSSAANFVFLLQFFGFFLLVFGLVLLKKKLS
jgi:hypothetical protein